MKKSTFAVILAGTVPLCGCQSRGSRDNSSKETYSEEDGGIQTSKYTAESAEITSPEQYAEMLSEERRRDWESLPERKMSLPQVNVFGGKTAADDYLAVIIYASYAKNMAAA